MTSELELDPAEEGGIRTATLVDVHVGRRIKAARLMLKLSQSDLAEKLALTFQQIQKYEKGTNRVSAGRLYQLSQILGVPVQFFFDELPPSTCALLEESTQEAMAQGSLHELGRQEIEVGKAFGRIRDTEVRRTLLAQIRAVADLGDATRASED